MEKVVTYYRVSTSQQGRSGLGLDAQRASVARYLATKPETTVLDEFEDVESGSRDDRPELAKALRRCRLTGATLIVAKLDRLSRDVEFIAALQKAALQKSGVSFVCADMPEANTLTIGLLAVLAQHERELISTRTRDALAAAKARGVRLGNPRLAEVANTDTTAARQAHVIKAAERNAMLAEIVVEIEGEAGEDLTLAEIADALNEAGYTTARGSKFTRTTVMRIRNAAQRATEAA